MNDAKPTPAATWTQFWNQRNNGAIDLHATDPVATAISQFWLGQADALQTCEQILDVGSGNAVLFRMLNAQLPAPPLPPLCPHWICLDHAQLPRTLHAEFGSRLTILDNTAFETSAPLNGGVGAIVSNFGFEYAHQAQAVKACARWLMPRGVVRLLVHALGSVIDRTSSVSAGDLHDALHTHALFDRAGALMSAMASLPNDPFDRMAHGVDERDAFNAAVSALKRRMDDRGFAGATLVEMLQGIQSLAPRALAKETGPVQAQLTQWRSQFEHELARLAAMQASALDAAGARHLAQQFETEGLTATLTSVDCALGQVGWAISARWAA